MAARRNPSSGSRIDESQAAGATRGASTGATSEAAGSGAGTAEAGVGAQKRFAESEVMTDIGQGEAYTVNMKRQVENAITHDSSLDHQERGMMEATKSAYQQMVEANAAAYSRLVSNAVTVDTALMTAVNDAVQKTSRTSLFEVDKLENVDETNAYAVTAIAKLADALGYTLTKKE